MTIKLQGTNSVASPGLTNDGGDGVVVGADSVDISTAGTSRVKVDSNGKVGIGTASPNKPLHIYTGSSDAEIRLQTNSGTEQNAYITSRNSGGALDVYSVNSAINFHPANTKRLEVLANGNVEVTDGDLVLGTSGHGIDFSATSDATNKDNELLDDYEEGTWGSVAQGGATCNISQNWYIKVGRKVTCNAKLNGFGGSGNTDTFKLALPFAATNEDCVGSLQGDTFNLMSDWKWVAPYTYGAHMSLLATRDNAGWESAKGNIFSSTTLIVSFTYRTAS